MVSLGTNTRKFQFFEELKEDVKLEEETLGNKINENKETGEENKTLAKLNISLSSIVPIKEMQILDEVIFLCATVLYKDTKQKQKSTRMLKIYKSQVIDEFLMFNNYIDFAIMRYAEKPLLIVFGSMKKSSENFHLILLQILLQLMVFLLLLVSILSSFICLYIII